MERKIPKEWALLLADLHNKVMDLQDQFEGFKSDLYSGEDLEDYDILEGFDIEELEEELEAICDQLDTIEAETSELDCEYNDYDSPYEKSDQECYKEAYELGQNLWSLFSGRDYEEVCYEFEEEPTIDITHKDNELIDINYGCGCYTFVNVNGKAIIQDSIEVWNGDRLLDMQITSEECARKGEIKE